jgi:hypothetical protein
MVLASRPDLPLQLIVLAPVIALLGAPVSAHAAGVSARLTMAERPATGEPCDASLWVIEAPADPTSPSRPVSPAAAAPVTASAPSPSAGQRADAERLLNADLVGSGPRSPRAPPVP